MNYSCSHFNVQCLMTSMNERPIDTCIECERIERSSQARKIVLWEIPPNGGDM